MKNLGIDFGNTNSLSAIYVKDRPALIPSPHSRFMHPSAVAWVGDGQILVGDAANELRITKPECCVSRFKHWMGSQESVQLGQQSFTASEISSFVLCSLKSDAEESLGHLVSKAVITVPAYFSYLQRRATRFAEEFAIARCKVDTSYVMPVFLLFGNRPASDSEKAIREKSSVVVSDFYGECFGVDAVLCCSTLCALIAVCHPGRELDF